MNKVVKAIFYLLSFSTLLLFALDWIVWGKYVPQASSLGLVGYIGVVIALSVLATFLEFIIEYIPEVLRTRR
jgi:hypothetical protein